MKNYVDLPVPDTYSADYAPLKWVKKNCPSYITNNAIQKNGQYYYRFFFSNSKDITMFVMRWV